jgi:16S rRNA (adenine1518-N6/adenine1519-N6)-dimethyltransferase
MPGKRKRTFLSQNFLVDEEISRSIVESFQVRPRDHVVEIGPGRGALTAHLVGRCEKLILVEKDRRLCRLLESRWGGASGVEILHADFLEVDLSRVRSSAGDSLLRVMGAIPYHITTPLIFHLLGYSAHVFDALLVVQKEVALRLAAEPGEKSYGSLSISVQYRTEPRLFFPVRKDAFHPKPRVDSHVVHLLVRREPPIRTKDPEFFFSLTRTLFTKRRKQIQKTLRTEKSFALTSEDLRAVSSAAGISLSKRPEELSMEELGALSDALRERLESAGFFHNE